ncbi:MAG TPA: hypothetical protein VGQ65_10415 [Thermoanaerobaculia bacterium]|jgi:hypothetical protein|nr:hypothetical protein [Thermoanaerobaculia bacterium]
MNRHCKALYVAVILLLASAPLYAGEGFGMMKKSANLTRIHPPQVFIAGTRVSIKVTAASSQYGVAAQRLESQLESELLGKNQRLKLDAARPDATIDVKILQDQFGEKWEDRQMVQYVDRGRKDSKGKTVLDQEQITVRFKVVTYSFTAAFKVHDTQKDVSLAADSINWNYSKDFQDGNGSPDASSLESNAVAAAVANLTNRLAPTREIVGVLLPKGTFEAAAAYADAGLWSKYQEALEKVPPLKNPTDEGYRQYALGVAYEAQGYSADDNDTTLKYLEQASIHYNNAVDANPKEGYFTKPYSSVLFSSHNAEAPISRVSAALVQYQKLKEFSDSLASKAITTRGSKGDLGAPADDAMTNQAVVDMVRAGLAEDVILTAIDTAKNAGFDITPRGLIQLADGKVSKRIIQHMQATTGKTSNEPKAKKSPAKKQ